MSTLRVSEIRNASSATGGLSIAADGVVSGALPSPNRNLLYNGAMQVAQRGTSTAGITSTGYYTADRFSVGIGSMGVWTQTVENDAPSGTGFRKSIRMLCTTAQTTLSGLRFCALGQSLEGQDLQRIRKGTSSAQQLTLSFWVKSNVTGTYIANLRDFDNTRSVSASYTISASATWEKKTITFPADTTGAFDNDNGLSLDLAFWLAAGSDFTSGTLNTTWAATNNANRAVGQTNLAAATNNYWQITGVQLEVGDAATGFEFKSYGQELAECQRYYTRNTTTNAYGVVAFGMCESATVAWPIVYLPVPMRTAPTSVEYSNLRVTDRFAINSGVTGLTLTTIDTSPQIAAISVTTSGGMTAQRPIFITGSNSATAYLAFSAEL